MPSGTAQRPGDVVKTHSGQTVEVINTDAEGRLVLADVLWYCQRAVQAALHDRPRDAHRRDHRGLGHEHAGLFPITTSWQRSWSRRARRSGEKLWRMPLGEAYDKLIKSDIADMKNIGGRPGGAITAAQFLQRFVNDMPWAHLDIAGMAWATKDAP